MASRHFWLLGGIVFLAGCSGGSSDLMPLELGTVTTYTVTAGLQRFVEQVKVERESPVAGTTGYELTGPMGVSRIAWKGGVLIAKQTANARFDPPIPLVAEDGKARTWRGRMESLGKTIEATADLTHKKEKLTVGSRQVNTVLSTLTIKKSDGSIELLSWFQPGVGLVQQEQRTGGVLVLRMEILGQPQKAD